MSHQLEFATIASRTAIFLRPFIREWCYKDRWGHEQNLSIRDLGYRVMEAY